MTFLMPGISLRVHVFDGILFSSALEHFCPDALPDIPSLTLEDILYFKHMNFQRRILSWATEPKPTLVSAVFCPSSP